MAVLRLRDRDVVLDARYAKSAKVNDPEIQQMTAKFRPWTGNVPVSAPMPLLAGYYCSTKGCINNALLRRWFLRSECSIFSSPWSTSRAAQAGRNGPTSWTQLPFEHGFDTATETGAAAAKN
ncbi:hypothetical protein HAP47_0025755 [Bradyrhizobium sp. 41S5]|uniref:hypothetical protein n=1 Tax=Bradyrhizobium sp. 41S5 TaxID=1404443 RepID=UPI00156B4384|nr:hypothetical protein [Bradyrhizobium sp. 41S5]UFX42633.1 hypothetical protein HAP47_0025755 [Bradyrhizobium sp. 41S5]